MIGEYVGVSGSPIPSEMTSMPAACLSAILRSSSANRYGGICCRRLLGCMKLLDELVGQAPGEHRDRPAAQGHVQVLLDRDEQLPAVEHDGHRRVAAPEDMRDRGAARPGARGARLADAALEDPRANAVPTH